MKRRSGTRQPGPGPLDELARRVEALFEPGRAPTTELIDPGQLLMSRHMVPNPQRPPGEKTPTFAPASDGYEVHILVRQSSAASAGTPSQLARPPILPSTGAPPKVELGRHYGAWTYVRDDGSQVAFTVRLGSDKARSDVNEILAAAASLVSL